MCEETCIFRRLPLVDARAGMADTRKEYRIFVGKTLGKTLTERREKG
jgi:hypothetical protein